MLNALSYIIQGELGIYISYVLICLLAITISIYFPTKKLSLLSKKELLLFLISSLTWGAFLFWTVGHTIFGGDISIYYSIARTFARGNFPIASPWQPDLSVKYHYGASILLGSLGQLTSLNYEFLHVAIAFFLLLSISQILVYLYKRHNSLLSLVFYQLLPVVALVTFGSFMVTWPIFPLKLPEIESINDFVKWGRDLPSAHISFESYAAVISIGLIVYFLFHSVALGIFFWITTMVTYPNYKNNIFYFYIFLFIGLASLALSNESLFIPSLTACGVIMAIKEFRRGSLRRIAKIMLLGVLFILIVVFQGGVISDGLLLEEEKSILVFPKQSDTRHLFKSYHQTQQSSKLFPPLEEWKPLRWYHLGFVPLYGISLIGFLYVFGKVDSKKLTIFLFFLISAIASSAAYNFIVPKYLMANGNRLMSIAYQMLGISTIFFIIWYLESLIKKNKIKLLLVVLFILAWIILPSTLVPLLQLSRTRFGENKLTHPKPVMLTGYLKWLAEETDASDRVLNLDSIAPFSNRNSHTLDLAGVLTPVFDLKHRAYTIDASPEHIDLVQTLNPELIELFKIDYLVIDSEYFENMPENRKKELVNREYFTLEYNESRGKEWTRIYKVNSSYLESTESLGGTFSELVSLIPSKSRVFIDDYQNVHPFNQYRKAIIFALREYEPYLVWGPGAYLNVENDLVTYTPDKAERFDYLVLFKDTNPNSICQCDAKEIWRGLNNNIVLWKVN